MSILLLDSFCSTLAEPPLRFMPIDSGSLSNIIDRGLLSVFNQIISILALKLLLSLQSRSLLNLALMT